MDRLVDMDHFGSKSASQATTQTTSHANENKSDRISDRVSDLNGDRISDRISERIGERNSDEQLADKNQTLINMVHMLTPATSPALNATSSLCNLNNTTSNGSSFSTIVPANPQALSKMTNGNGLIGTDRPACRSTSSSSNGSDLSAKSGPKPEHQASQPLCANPLSNFPFFNTFNLLHPILNNQLNKHLYSGNGLNFSPFAYLNQLQNMRQMTGSTGLTNSGQSNFVTNLVTNQLTNSTNSTTGSNAPVVADSSLVANPQHALRCKDEISSLVSGSVLVLVSFYY